MYKDKLTSLSITQLLLQPQRLLLLLLLLLLLPLMPPSKRSEFPGASELMLGGKCFEHSPESELSLGVSCLSTATRVYEFVSQQWLPISLS